MKSILFKIINYFKEVRLFTTSYSLGVFLDPLDEKEENEYIELLLKGNKEARNKLIEHNLRLVAHIVKKYESSNISSDDLISIDTNREREADVGAATCQLTHSLEERKPVMASRRIWS